MSSLIDESGRHLGDDGTRQFRTVMQFFDPNKYEPGVSIIRYRSFIHPIITGLVASFGRLQWDEARHTLTTLQRMHSATSDAHNTAYGMVLQYLHDWSTGDPRGVRCGIGRYTSVMSLKELLSLLAEQPMRLKWLHKDLFSHREVVAAEKASVLWAIPTSIWHDELDVEQTLKYVNHLANGVPPGIYSKVQPTEIETVLGHQVVPLFHPVTGEAYYGQHIGDLPAELVHALRAQLPHQDQALKRELEENPRLLYNPKHHPMWLTALVGVYRTLPERWDQAGNPITRYHPDGIHRDHPEYPIPLLPALLET